MGFFLRSWAFSFAAELFAPQLRFLPRSCAFSTPALDTALSGADAATDGGGDSCSSARTPGGRVRAALNLVAANPDTTVGHGPPSQCFRAALHIAAHRPARTAAGGAVYLAVAHSAALRMRAGVKVRPNRSVRLLTTCLLSHAATSYFHSCVARAAHSWVRDGCLLHSAGAQAFGERDGDGV